MKKTKVSNISGFFRARLIDGPIDKNLLLGQVGHIPKNTPLTLRFGELYFAPLNLAPLGRKMKNEKD
jgi:hypothetical protein